jgi:hypothetical protein
MFIEEKLIAEIAKDIGEKKYKASPALGTAKQAQPE